MAASELLVDREEPEDSPVVAHLEGRLRRVILCPGAHRAAPKGATVGAEVTAEAEEAAVGAQATPSLCGP